MWTKTVENDLDSHKLSWTEAVNLAPNRPLWRLLATSGATHSCMQMTMRMMHIAQKLLKEFPGKELESAQIFGGC